MKTFLIVLVVISIIVLCYIIWQKNELKKFMISKYQIHSAKIKKDANVAVLADLHGFEYGKSNTALRKAIKEYSPDLILIAGDMIVSKFPETYESSLETLKGLVQIAPVYYSFGNHESRVNTPELTIYPLFREFIKQVEEIGVHVINNETCDILVNQNRISLYGLEIDMKYYEKKKDVSMDAHYVTSCLGEPDQEQMNILLAHNPTYSEQYAAWGADLTFCGHNHGGLIRIPGIGSVFSPQLTTFPKYDAGLYHLRGKDVIVSRGLGTHTFHIRINNRAELMFVRLTPRQ